MVVAQELPDVLDGVEFGRPGWQRQERDVRGHDERPGEMPARLVEHEDGVRVRRHHGADLVEMRLHRGGVAVWHDEAGALALGRADRPEGEPLSAIGPRTMASGPGRALVVRRSPAGPAPRPSPGQPVLLADPCFILPPELHVLARMGVTDLAQALQETFLKASAASGSCA